MPLVGNSAAISEARSSGPAASVLTVLIAFGANLLIAVAKPVAAALTDSASMVAEAAHSWADAGNEVFLLVAERRAARTRDERHPLGYGKEAYIWSLFAALGLFTAGAVVSIMHGVGQLTSKEPVSDFTVAYIVLGVSAVLEGVSFTQAYRQARTAARRRGLGTVEGVLASSNPTLRGVFAEDAAALAGIAIAVLGILLHQLSGLPVYDAAGSILIGVLLAVVAVVLIDRNRRFLVGQDTPPEVEQAVVDRLLQHPDVARVTYLHLEFVGPERVYLVAAVDIRGNEAEDRVAEALRRIERDVELDPHILEVVLTLSSPEDTSLPSSADA
jgi:cation diffusion facilitator family transporter